MKSGMGEKKRIFNHFMFDDTNISELMLHQSTRGRLQLGKNEMVVFQMERRNHYNKEVEVSDWSQKRSCFTWIVGAITTKKSKGAIGHNRRRMNNETKLSLTDQGMVSKFWFDDIDQ
jgi:hypothetical protein